MEQKSNHIIPAIMPNSFQDLEDMVSRVRTACTAVQIDIMDGKYVPEKTFPFFKGDDSDLQALKTETIGMPYWKDIDYELDLMVEHPEDRMDDWLAFGPARIIFHPKSLRDPVQTFTTLQEYRGIVGISVAIEDDADMEIFETIKDFVDSVQVMGIAQIGYQGEPFDEQSIRRIKKIHQQYPDMVVSVDGGVNEKTIQILRDAGATQFVAGSAVFNASNPQEKIQELGAMVH